MKDNGWAKPACRITVTSVNLPVAREPRGDQTHIFAGQSSRRAIRELIDSSPRAGPPHCHGKQLRNCFRAPSESAAGACARPGN
ncbi:hypothetical protein EVAR_23725_1 [Eumeta japonica]|uniref:Uncharacterized protein n=1 Tax=Eumeta variegata TaxID=151549 RepID=A0A4C1VFN9_EUMVA|nr:hypothetical protein EVAR_23725_1 [Eumeta japonica]